MAPHPGLAALWASDRPELGAVRWRLLVTTVSPALDPHKVRGLPPRLLIPTLVLAFLNESGWLEDWEIDAVLATAVCLPQYNSRRLAALPADPVTARGIRVANLVMRSTFVLYLLLAACGYPESVQETAPWLFFDGKLFQEKYNEAKSGCTEQHLCGDRDENRQWFLKARDVVYKQ